MNILSNDKIDFCPINDIFLKHLYYQINEDKYTCLLVKVPVAVVKSGVGELFIYTWAPPACKTTSLM